MSSKISRITNELPKLLNLTKIANEREMYFQVLKLKQNLILTPNLFKILLVYHWHPIQSHRFNS